MMRKLLLTLCMLLFVSVAQAKEGKRVFIVASYSKDHICGKPQEIGVMKGLNKEGWFEGLNLKVERYYMNTKRKNTTKKAIKEQALIALDKIYKFHPDVVIFLDDNAIREVMLPLAKDERISLVFSGMNGQPEDYNKKVNIMKNRQQPGKKVTGVYEKLYVKRSLNVMSKAVPGLKGNKVVIITDFTPTGNALTKQFEMELKDKVAGIDWELKRVKNWEEYQALIHRINKDDKIKVIYPVALSLKTADGKTFTAPEIFKWTMEHSKKPEMALNYFFSKVGLFGGAAVDFKGMGQLAGIKAGQILNGTPAGGLAIEDAPDYAIVFNLKRAKQLNIKIPDPLLTAADFIYKE